MEMPLPASLLKEKILFSAVLFLFLYETNSSKPPVDLKTLLLSTHHHSQIFLKIKSILIKLMYLIYFVELGIFLMNLLQEELKKLLQLIIKSMLYNLYKNKALIGE